MNIIRGAFRSRTMWFNLITGVLAILALPEIIALIPAAYLGKLLIINAVGNLILRLLTNQSLVDK